MKNDSLTKLLLFIIALALISIALRPFVTPGVAHAEGSAGYPV